MRFSLGTVLAVLVVTGWLTAAVLENQTGWWVAGAIVVYIAAVMARN